MSLLPRHNPHKRCFAPCPPGKFCECLGYEIPGEPFEDWISGRDKAVATLDMEYARKMMPGAASDEVRLCAMHKARYEMKRIAPELRHESRAWLEKNGYKRFMDLPWPTEGGLPE